MGNQNHTDAVAVDESPTIVHCPKCKTPLGTINHKTRKLVISDSVAICRTTVLECRHCGFWKKFVLGLDNKRADS